MKWFYIFICSLIGGFAIGPLGALAGILIPWFLLTAHERRSRPRKGHRDRDQFDFFSKAVRYAQASRVTSSSLEISVVAFETLFQVAGYIAKSDGRISKHEIDIAQNFMRKMQLSESDRRNAIGKFKEGASGSFDIDACLTRIRVSFDRSREVGHILLRALAELALADGMSPLKGQVLRDYAKAFSLDPSILERLFSRSGFQGRHGERQDRRQHSYERQSETQALAGAYQRLGVSAEATDDEVKRAYHNLIREYHPDRLMSKGLPKSLLDRANEVTREAHESWETIKDARNIR